MAKDTETVLVERPRRRGKGSVILRGRRGGDPAVLLLALRETVQAQEGGFAWLSRRTRIGRSGLYKALSENGNPSYATVCRVLEALGMEIVVVRNAPAPTRAKVMTSTKVAAHTGGQLIRSASGPLQSASQPSQKPTKKRIQPGSAKGMIYYMADDFDAPLAEFAEYMG